MYFSQYFGILINNFLLLSYSFYNDRLGIFFEFIPQMIFICSIFGYLVILIFVKWVKYTAAQSSCAPSLLIGLINMFMMKYNQPTGDCSGLIYSGQPGFQTFLLVLAVLCVPVMLCAKPYLLYRRHKARASGVSWILHASLLMLPSSSSAEHASK